MLKLATTTFALGVLATSTLAQTTLRAASAFGPTHVHAVHAFPAFAEALERETDGAYTARDFPSGLVAPNEAISALQDGIIEMGSIAMVYFPADFIESGLPGELAFLGSSPRAMANATLEYLITCEPCLNEFASLGIVPLSGGSTTSYQILSLSPIATLEDFEGLRIRIAGAVYGRWAEFMGGQSVQMPSTEIFEALNQRTVDAVFGSFTEIQNQQIQDVIGNATRVNFGVFNGFTLVNLRQEFWSALDADTKEAFLDAALYAQVAGTQGWLEADESALSLARENNINLLEPGQDVSERMVAFRAEHLARLPTDLAVRGIEDAAAKIDRFVALVDKWTAILDGAELTTAEHVGLLRSEIWSNVDLATFGR
jgi:TRAP-type C4-dicarboxylate transport system substrate-binding protein